MIGVVRFFVVAIEMVTKMDSEMDSEMGGLNAIETETAIEIETAIDVVANEIMASMTMISCSNNR